MKLRPRLALTTIAVALPMIALFLLADAASRARAAERELTTIALRDVDAADAQTRCERDPARFGAMGPPRARRGPSGPPPGALGPPPGALGPPPDALGPPPDALGPPPGPPDAFGPPRGALGLPPGALGPPPGSPHQDLDEGPPPPPPGGSHRRPLSMFVYDSALRGAVASAPPLDAALAKSLRAGEARSVSELGSADVAILVRTAWGEGPCSFVLARGTKEPWLGALLPATHVWLVPLVVLFAAVLLAVGPSIQRIRRLTRAVRASAASAYQGSIPVEGNDEVSELGQAFRSAAGELRAELAAKDRREQALRNFLRDTTHDVMIPLTVLSGHLTALRDATATGETFDEALLSRAMDEAHYMAALVHNLGAAAKLDAEEVPLQRGQVSLNALLERVLARHAPIARQLGVSLNGAPPEESLRASADVTLLEQAVSNLVYNAIRHNRQGGHVAVILEPADADHFLLRVLDDGPGVAPEELARLVERGFRSSEARQRTPDGQGLGLSIAQRVAALHGFTLEFTRSEFGGLQVDLRGKLVQSAPNDETRDEPASAK